MSEHEDDELRWEVVGSVEEWEEGEARELRFGARRIAVFKALGEFHAFKNRCPHRGLPLLQEQRARVEDGCLTCPHHGWRFSLEDGAGPEDSCLRPYPLRQEQGQLFIGL